MAPATVDAPPAALEPARAEPVVEARQPATEPRLRQADRRPGGRADHDPAPAREGVGFGGDVPAFLRRSVTLKS
jgi:hypothetical protein